MNKTNRGLLIMILLLTLCHEEKELVWRIIWGANAVAWLLIVVNEISKKND